MSDGVFGFDATEPVVVGDMIEEENIAPLTDQEESQMAANIEDNEMIELMELYNRVVAMRDAMVAPGFNAAYFKPIDGNIAMLRNQLETEEKSREVVLAQGKLSAYKAMRDFPVTCVEMFNVKLASIRENFPLFLKDSVFVRNVVVTYDEKNHSIRITSSGTKEEE